MCINFKKCINCGACRNLCPVFIVLKDETFSPRGKNIADIERDQDFLYKFCTNCKACVSVCPLGIGFDVIKKREEFVSLNLETQENKAMIDNIRKYGNPFGGVDNNKNDTHLYCC